MTITAPPAYGTTAVASVSAENNVMVYPNPNKGVFTVKGTLATAEDQDLAVEVTDMLGQVVYRGKVAAREGKLDEQISLTGNLANGMYMLNLHCGAEVKVFHFVIGQ